MSIEQELFKLISELASIDDVKRIEPIEKGNSHACFQVITHSQKYFAKHFSSHSLTYQVESDITRLMSDHEIAPKVIFNNRNWLICQYIDTNSNHHNSEVNFTNQCLSMMAELHEIQLPSNVKLPKLNLKDTVTTLYQSSSFSFKQQSFLRELVVFLYEDKPDEETQNDNIVICHGDLNYENFLLGNVNNYLIDFECSHLALPEFDLAMFFAVNMIPLSLHAQYQDYYSTQRQSSYKTSHKNVTRYLMFSYLINGLWYFDKSKTNGCLLLMAKAVLQFEAFDALNIYPKSLLKQMR